MTLTKQTFVLIASIVRELDPVHRPAIAKAFADQLARTNPRFDRDRFLSACEDR